MTTLQLSLWEVAIEAQQPRRVEHLTNCPRCTARLKADRSVTSEDFGEVYRTCVTCGWDGPTREPTAIERSPRQRDPVRLYRKPVSE